MDILARLANLPGALPGACAQGLIWGIMAIGVYLTFRILDIADMTAEERAIVKAGCLINYNKFKAAAE